MSFRRAFAILGLTFVIALAAIAAFRLSEQAMAVVVGVIRGTMTAIPMSILLLLALQRFCKRQEARGYAAQSPVVLVNPGNPHNSSRFADAPYFPLPRQQVTPRDFKIIGHEACMETDDDIFAEN